MRRSRGAGEVAGGCIRSARLKAELAPYGRLREVIGNARPREPPALALRDGAALDSPDLSNRVRTVLEESGGMMVKLGQIASTRNDVLPRR